MNQSTRSNEDRARECDALAISHPGHAEMYEREARHWRGKAGEEDETKAMEFYWGPSIPRTEEEKRLYQLGKKLVQETPMKLKSFSIEANGTPMGVYEGRDEAEASLACTRDAGYDSHEEAAEVCGQTVEEFLADQVLVEVRECPKCLGEGPRRCSGCTANELAGWQII